MKCDVSGCEEEAVSVGMGFEPGKELSARCRDHRWTHAELGKILLSSAQSLQAWSSLNEGERQFVLNAAPEERTQVFQALFKDKVDPRGDT